MLNSLRSSYATYDFCKLTNYSLIKYCFLYYNITPLLYCFMPNAPSFRPLVTMQMPQALCLLPSAEQFAKAQEEKAVL
jgi:hypothetical protein